MTDQFREYGPYTDPGEFEYLFKDLPKSAGAVIEIIKDQFIHPIADLPLYRRLLPPDRRYEDEEFPTVRSLLAGLLSRNPDGLRPGRIPEERLVVSCRYHSILLAAILKSRSVPVRCRYGFARYLMPGRHVYHVICEYLDEDRNRWVFTDPDRKMTEVLREDFTQAGEAWLGYRGGSIDPSKYGVMSWWGAHAVLDVLCHDIASILGNEYLYWEHPPVSADPAMDAGTLPRIQLDILDRAARLSLSHDEDPAELASLYAGNEFLRIVPGGGFTENFLSPF